MQIEQEERLAALQDLVTQLDRPGLSIERLLEIREEIREYRLSARTMLTALSDARAAEREALDILGPAPDGDAGAEAASVVRARAELALKLDLLNRTISQSEFTAALATQTLERIASMRQAIFLENVFSQGTAVYTPAVWNSAKEASLLALARLQRLTEVWWDRRARIGALGSTLLIGFGVLFAIGVLAVWTRRVIDDVIAPRIPDDATPQEILVPAQTLLWTGMTVVTQCLIAAGLWQVGVSVDGQQRVGIPIAISLTCFVFTWHAAKTIVGEGANAPNEATVQRVRLLVRGIVLTYFVIATILAFAQSAISSVDLISVFAFIGAASITIQIFLLLRADEFAVLIGRDMKAEGVSLLWRLRIPLQIATLIVLATSLFGLSVLSGYLMSILIKVGVLLWAFVLLRQVFGEYVSRSTLVRRAEALMSSGNEAPSSDEENEAFWWRLTFDVLALSVIVPLGLLVIGVEIVDIVDFVRSLLLGFTIGGISISLTEILSSVGIFVAVLFATRMIQRALDKRILPRTKLDIGVRNSLVTLTGYLGMVLAVAIAVTAVGFDLSSLTIIAGALSVGIGFGLQSIVNNFVSGLILLFERPIKVGDWIVTASGEGSVRKISVRSTEIETFDRCTIIVPNSELISAAVQNWTHKDMSGRAIVSVGVAYHSDPYKVREILMDCAKRSKYALKYPEPYIYWRDYGASSLDFEVRFFIRDISYVVWAKNDLRFEIFDALKENGIEIPFPQRDVHLRDMDRLEAVLDRRLPDTAAAKNAD